MACYLHSSYLVHVHHFPIYASYKWTNLSSRKHSRWTLSTEQCLAIGEHWVERNLNTQVMSTHRKRGGKERFKGGARGGKKGKIVSFSFFFQNLINSWFKKYEPARLRFLGNSGRNHFQLSPTLAGKSPNLTRTLALFLGLCPTLSICLMDNDASLDRPASIKHQLKI